MFNRLPKAVRITICLLLVLLAAVAGYSWGHRPTDQNNNLANTDGGRAFAGTEQVLKEVGQAAITQYGHYRADSSIWFAENTPAGKATRVKGFDFKLDTAAEPQLQIDSSVYYENILNNTGATETELLPAVTKAVVGSFMAHGFSEQTSPAANDSLQSAPTGPSTPNGTSVQTMKLTKGDVVCTLQELDGDFSDKASCTSPAIDTYLAAQMAPFVNLEAQAKHISVQSITAGPLVIRGSQPGKQGDGAINASETAGYNLAELVLTHGKDRRVALYYAHNNQWHFITEATDEYGFSCNDVLANPDARKAMYDQVCYDSQQGQYRVDSNRHY